jgi:hypothetical protein
MMPKARDAVKALDLGNFIWTARCTRTYEAPLGLRRDKPLHVFVLSNMLKQTLGQKKQFGSLKVHHNRPKEVL